MQLGKLQTMSETKLKEQIKVRRKKMRELKFRVWSKEAGEYLKGEEAEGFVLKLNGTHYVEMTFGYYDNGKDWVIEQCTGLKDKNGKEIYEGDIVDYNDDGECIGVVKYDAPEFYLDADATNWAKMFLKEAPYQRVVGNIHENPELLEEK